MATISQDRPAPPAPYLILSDPVRLFDALASRPDARRPLRWLRLAQPLLPVYLVIGGYGYVAQALRSVPELAERGIGPAWFVGLLAILTLGAQVALIAVHLAVFTTLSRLAGAASGARILAVWAYSMVLLIPRQAFYVLVAVAVGPDWLFRHAALVGALDPFVVGIGVVLYLGLRRVLELGRAAAVFVALSSSVAGSLALLLPGMAT